MATPLVWKCSYKIPQNSCRIIRIMIVATSKEKLRERKQETNLSESHLLSDKWSLGWACDSLSEEWCYINVFLWIHGDMCARIFFLIAVTHT